jgi:hypothetical protein
MSTENQNSNQPPKQPFLFATGVFKAVPLKAGLHRTPTGYLQCMVEFRLEEGPNSGMSITWFGGLGSQKAFAFSVPQLQKLGWKGDPTKEADWDAFPNWKPTIPSVSLVIVEEDRPAQAATPSAPARPAGKRSAIKYINIPGESGGSTEKLMLKGADAAVASKSLAADAIKYAAAAASGGGEAPAGPKGFETGGDGDAPTAEDLPF